MATASQDSSRSSIRRSRGRPLLDSFRKLVPAPRGQEPGDVRGRGRQRCSPRALWIRDIVAAPAGARRSGSRAPVTLWLWFTVLFANFAEAVAEGRGKAQADALRKMRKETTARRLVDGSARRTVPASSCARATWSSSRPGMLIPGDGEVIEGIASVDESAITGESAPVIRESGGDRSAVTGGTKVLSDRIVVRITAEPGRVLPRPHDRARRGRRAAEDAQRDRAAHPARRADARLPVRLRDARAARALLRGRALGDGHRGAAGLPDPDHHRRPALGHRHRRHGPPAAQERHRDERARGRGGGRRGHAAARQDRHHHARQPHGDRARPDARRAPSRSWPTRPSSPAWPTRRPRGAPSWCSSRSSYGSARPRGRGDRRPLRPLLRADADERLRSRRPHDPQGRGGCHRRARRRRSAATRPGRARGARATGSRDAGGTPLAVADGRRVLGRHPPEGRGQGRHPGALRRASARWASARS